MGAEKGNKTMLKEAQSMLVKADRAKAKEQNCFRSAKTGFSRRQTNLTGFSNSDGILALPPTAKARDPIHHP
jgi:hypothetical protein